MAGTMADRLNANGTLKVNETITSPNGHFTLKYQADGRLVLYHNNVGPIWWSEWPGIYRSVGVCRMQNDGNLVLYGPGDDIQELGSEKISSSPAACSWSPNRIDVFVRGTDDCLYTKSWNGSKWSDVYHRLGPEKFIGDPAACSWSPNRIDVFVRGTDDCLYTKSWNGSKWSDVYSKVGGLNFNDKMISGPSACSWSPNRIDVFFKGNPSTSISSGSKYWSYDGSNGSFGGWVGNEKYIGDPAATSGLPSREDIFVRGTDDCLYGKSRDVTNENFVNKSFKNLGPEKITSSPAVCSTIIDSYFNLYRNDVFVRGTDGRIYHKKVVGNGFTSSFSPYSKVGEAEITGKPAAVTWGPDRIDVFYISKTNTLCTKTWNGTEWSGSKIWETMTDRHPGSRLVMQDDGNLVIYDSSNAPIWSTNTVHKVVDWRNHQGINAVTPVQSQKQCGACVGFATIALLESMLLIERAMLTKLSEAEFFFCAGGSCSTGLWDGRAMQRALNEGAVRENFLPYTANFKTSSQPCPNLPNNIRVKATHEVNFVTNQSRKIYLDQVGPMIATFDGYDDFKTFWFGGIGIYSHQTGKFEDRHCVLVIGYDDIERCWICKNSWPLTFSGAGTTGFFRMDYDSKCNFETWGFRGLNGMVTGSNF